MKKIKALIALSIVALVGCQATPEPQVSASINFKCERYAKANVTKIEPQTPLEAVVAGVIEAREKRSLKLKCMRRYL